MFNLLFLTIIFVVFGTIDGCTNNYVLSGDAINCVVVRDKRTCSLNLNTEVTLLDVGSTTCLTYKYENDTVLDISIKYTSLLNVVTLRQEYVTTTWYLDSRSERRCPGSGYCNEEICSAPQAANPEPSDDPFMNIPGISRCILVSGAGGIAVTGCVSAASSCLFTRAVIAPVYNAEMYMIYSFVKTIQYPIVYIEIKGSQNFNTFMGGSGYKRTLGNFDFVLEGVFNVPFDHLDNNGIAVPVFINKDGNKYYTPIEKRNSPRAGIVGDLQAQSPGDISRLNYLISPDLIQIKTNTMDTVTYMYDIPGVTIMENNSPKLPVDIGGNSYDFYSTYITPSNLDRYNDVLVGKVKNAGVLKMFMQAKKPIEWSTTIKAVCPVVRNVTVGNLSCYDCRTGAKLILLAYGDCGEGQVGVKINNYTVITKSVYLTKNLTLITITFNANVVNVKGTVCLTEKYSQDSCINFKGTLLSDIEIRKFNLSETISHSPTGSGDISIDTGGILDSIKNFFGNTWQIWAIVGGVIVGLIVLGLCLFITIKCCFLRMAVNGSLTGAPL